MHHATVTTHISENENTLRRFIDEVINSQRLEVIDEIVHPDYAYCTPGQELHGRQALKSLFSAYHTAFPDLTLHIDELISMDDRVVLLFTLTGTHRAEFMDITATGKSVSIKGVLRSRFDAGQIIEEWELLDQLSLLQQLDIVPAH